MNSIKSHLAEKKPVYSYADAESLMEDIYHHYMDFNPVDNQRIQDDYNALFARYPHLAPKEEDDVFDTIADLCIQYEREGFLAGIRVGLQLMLEIDAYTKGSP